MKPRLFYGWYIVIAGLVLSAYYSSMFIYGWTAFVNPIIVTFGWSMAQISLASSMSGLEAGVFNPLWGTVVDRWPARKLMMFGLTTTASGIFLLSQTRNLGMYFGGLLLMGLGSSLVTSILPQTVIARWFRKDTGKASGLFFMGVGLGGVAVPLVVRIIDRLTWQTTLLYGAIGLLVLGMPLSLVFRSRPETYGQFPDGKVPESGPKPLAYDFGTSIKQAIRMRAFWYIGAVSLFQMSANSTVSLHVMPYLTGLGVDRATAGTVVMLFTLGSLFTRIPMGLLADIFRKTHVLALSVGLQVAGVFVLWLVNGTSPYWFIALSAIIYGAGLGGLNPLRAPILSEYFGIRNFGTLYGVTGVFLTLGSVISQPLAGWIYDTYHDYKIWWLAVLVFGALALVLVLTIPRPRERMAGAALMPGKKGA
jgi:MFS family permease